MKIIQGFFLSLAILGLFACQPDETQQNNRTSASKVPSNLVLESASKAETEQKALPDIYTEYYGIYTGDFVGIEMVKDGDDEYEQEITTKISLKINSITEEAVYGHSIVKGKQRPFTGVFDASNKTFVLDEPGDDKTDGRFTVKLKGDNLTGKWVAYQKLAVKAPNKTLNLAKKSFVYNANFMLDPDTDLIDWENPKEFIEKYTDSDSGEVVQYKEEKNRVASEAVFKLNGSKHTLTEKQLKNLRKLDLEIIKNTIYARHGYSFKKETYRYFFEQTDWYIPTNNDVSQVLTPLEKNNIALLNRFIKYAEDEYDRFGR